MSGNGTGNTGVKTGNGHFMPGHDPRRGHGLKGRSGRKPDWIKDFCDDLLADPKCKAQVRAILRNKDHPAFATMWKAAGDRAYGKADQKVEQTGDVTIRVTREPRSLVGDN